MRVYLIYGNQDIPCKVRSLPNRYKFDYLFNLKPSGHTHDSLGPYNLLLHYILLEHSFLAIIYGIISTKNKKITTIKQIVYE